MLFGFADVIPRVIGNETGVLFFLNSCPPKPFKNCVNFFNESFGKKNSRHVINRNGSKHRFDILQPISMVKFISLESTKFSKEFVMNEVVSFVFVSMTEDH